MSFNITIRHLDCLQFLFDISNAAVNIVYIDKPCPISDYFLKIKMCNEAVSNIASRSVNWYNNSSGKQFDIMYSKVKVGSWLLLLLNFVSFLVFLRHCGSGDGNVLSWLRKWLNDCKHLSKSSNNTLKIGKNFFCLNYISIKKIKN